MTIILSSGLTCTCTTTCNHVFLDIHDEKFEHINLMISSYGNISEGMVSSKAIDRNSLKNVKRGGFCVQYQF